MTDADCTPGREPCSVAASSKSLMKFICDAFSNADRHTNNQWRQKRISGNNTHVCVCVCVCDRAVGDCLLSEATLLWVLTLPVVDDTLWLQRLIVHLFSTHYISHLNSRHSSRARFSDSDANTLSNGVWQLRCKGSVTNLYGVEKGCCEKLHMWP